MKDRNVFLVNILKPKKAFTKEKYILQSNTKVFVSLWDSASQTVGQQVGHKVLSRASPGNECDRKNT